MFISTNFPLFVNSGLYLIEALSRDNSPGPRDVTLECHGQDSNDEPDEVQPHESLENLPSHLFQREIQHEHQQGEFAETQREYVEYLRCKVCLRS